jgi:hypothetical protein
MATAIFVRVWTPAVINEWNNERHPLCANPGSGAKKFVSGSGYISMAPFGAFLPELRQISRSPSRQIVAFTPVGSAAHSSCS